MQICAVRWTGREVKCPYLTDSSEAGHNGSVIGKCTSCTSIGEGIANLTGKLARIIVLATYTKLCIQRPGLSCSLYYHQPRKSRTGIARSHEIFRLHIRTASSLGASLDLPTEPLIKLHPWRVSFALHSRSEVKGQKGIIM